MSDGTLYANLPMELTTYVNRFENNITTNYSNYGIRLDINEWNKVPIQYYNSGQFTGEGTSFDDKPDKYFQDAYQNPSIESNVLNYHECYVNQKFLSYARTLPHYNQHILDLQKKIENGEKFIVPGFKQKFFLWWKKNKFHDFINDEANKIKSFEDKVNKIKDAQIKQLQSIPRLRFNKPQDLDPLIKNCAEQLEHTFDNIDLNKRLDARIKAIEYTIKHPKECFDYSSQVKHPKFTDPYADVFNNCYGTELDKQLHEELCDTRIAMMDLQSNYADNLQVRAFAPIVYQATGLAKKEQNVEKAFNLSDFSYDLVRIVTGGVRLMVLAINDPSIAARGIASGIKTTCNPQHWVDLGMGLVKFTILLADECGRHESLDDAFDYGTATRNYDLFLEKSSENEEYHRKIRQAIQQEFHETSEKLKNLSDEKLIEGIFSFGTTFMLDGVILKAASLATTIEGRALLSQWAKALNSPFAKEYVLNAAGVGKLTLEEGADITNMAIEIVEKNPKLLSDGKTVNQVVQNISKDLHKAKFTKIINELGVGELKFTQNFRPGALEHILEGELNAKGKAVGFHYEGMPSAKGKVISGTEIPPNQFGVYIAQVEVNGVPKVSNGGKSSFFPKDWDAQKIVNSINEAFENKKLVEGTRNTFRGLTSNELEIEMYIDNVSGKIISAFPKY